MSFQIFLGAEQQARVEMMRLDFLVWKDKSSKQMEEHMRRIKSFSPLCNSPASKSPPITPAPPAPPSVVDLCRSVHQQPLSPQMHRPPHIRPSFHRLSVKHRIKQPLWSSSSPPQPHIQKSPNSGF
jgi:hypothetical protein